MSMLAYVWPSVAGQRKSAVWHPWDTLVVIKGAEHSLRAVLMEALALVPSHVIAHSMGNKGLVKAISHQRGSANPAQRHPAHLPCSTSAHQVVDPAHQPAGYVHIPI
jgi:hypothetical protein